MKATLHGPKQDPDKKPQAWAWGAWHRKALAPIDRVGEAAADMAFVPVFVGQDGWLIRQPLIVCFVTWESSKRREKSELGCA